MRLELYLGGQAPPPFIAVELQAPNKKKLAGVGIEIGDTTGFTEEWPEGVPFSLNFGMITLPMLGVYSVVCRLGNGPRRKEYTFTVNHLAGKAPPRPLAARLTRDKIHPQLKVS